jgi:hypothetical protein
LSNQNRGKGSFLSLAAFEKIHVAKPLQASSLQSVQKKKKKG